MLPAEVESWRILLEKKDESVWSADEYIYTQKHTVTKSSSNEIGLDANINTMPTIFFV